MNHIWLKKSIWLYLSLLFLLSGSSGLAQTFRDQLYQYYISGQMNAWESLMNQKARQIHSEQDRYELALAYYGYIGYCLGSEQKDKARQYIEWGEKLADQLLEVRPGQPEYLALRGAYYGFRMGFQPQKIMSLGPKSLRLVNQAVEAGPDNPYALIEEANKDWWMPEIFGGSKDRALKGYERAVSQFEKDPESAKNNWYYLNIQMILADWYIERGMAARSTYLYKKLLRFEPDFEWAKEKLNP